jgi:hypothetical protein
MALHRKRRDFGQQIGAMIGHSLSIRLLFAECQENSQARRRTASQPANVDSDSPVARLKPTNRTEPTGVQASWVKEKFL